MSEWQAEGEQAESKTSVNGQFTEATQNKRQAVSNLLYWTKSL